MTSVRVEPMENGRWRYTADAGGGHFMVGVCRTQLGARREGKRVLAHLAEQAEAAEWLRWELKRIEGA